MQLNEIVVASEAVRATRSRIRKRQALASVLQTMSEGEVGIGVSYLSGLLPQGRIGLGYAAVHAADATPSDAPTLSLRDVDTVITDIAATTGAGSVARRGQ